MKPQMIKHLLIICALTISACCHQPKAEEQGDVCPDQRFRETNRIKAFDKIDERGTLSKKDVEELIEPFEDSFKFDSDYCKGYTKRVVDAAKKILDRRSEKVTPQLYELCSQEISPSLDLIGYAKAEQQKKAARKALEYIKQPTDLCE